jgi:hypothetical protein
LDNDIRQPRFRRPENKDDFLNAVKGYFYFIGGEETAGDYQEYSSFAAHDDRLCNYSIPVYDNYGKILYNVYVLDSGSYNKVAPVGEPYRYINEAQTEWYESEALRLKAQNGGAVVPSILFTHIPLIEHGEAYAQGGAQIGIWNGFSPSTVRSVFFESSFAMGDIRGIFTGHNYENSISCFYEREGHKIMMGITPAARANSYTDTESVLKSRVVVLKEDGNFFTYIHTSATGGIENGKILYFS